MRCGRVGSAPIDLRALRLELIETGGNVPLLVGDAEGESDRLMELNRKRSRSWEIRMEVSKPNAFPSSRVRASWRWQTSV